MAVICILSLLVVVFSHLPAEVTAQSTLELLYSTPLENRLENRITIGCYLNTFPVDSPHLMFWVRRPGLVMADQLQSLVTVQQRREQVAFVITQDLEGSYFCSLSNMQLFSNTLDLVAYPQANITIPLFYVFQPGQSATIDCRVMPGRLSQYYSVSWRKDSFQIATSEPRFVFPGYQLHDNFSLTIDNIQTSDPSSNYQCVVTIDDPRISGTVNHQPDLGRITVLVYLAPSIVTPPMQRVIAVPGNELQNTTFVCQATGFPTPQISWLHNGQKISRSTDERFQAVFTDAGGSRLNISQLRGRDSGTIECVASSRVDIPNMQPLAANTSSVTTLSVLTDDFDLLVTITMGGDVQFMITPIDEDYLIPELTRLRISFTSQEEERNGVIRNATSIAAFMNAERIFYQIPSSEVPFQRFRVQVAQLVEGKTGPLVPSDLDSATIYDQRAPTPTLTEQCNVLIVGASLGAALLVAIIIVVVAVTCCCYCTFKSRENHKTKETELEERKKHLNWARVEVEIEREDFRKLRQYLCDTNKPELIPDCMAESRKLCSQLLNLGPVQPDEGEWNEEIEKERNKQILIFLKDILKRGKSKRSLKTDMLKTIIEEVGSEVKEFE